MLSNIIFCYAFLIYINVIVKYNFIVVVNWEYKNTGMISETINK